MFDALGRAMRRAGYATLAFDYSGHGESGDEIITFDPLIEDFRSASGWLADQGFTRQICVGHEFGATVALRARPSAVQTYVLVSPDTMDMSARVALLIVKWRRTDSESLGMVVVPWRTSSESCTSENTRFQS